MDYATSRQSGSFDEVKILRTWRKPKGGVTQREGTAEEIDELFKNLPKELSGHLREMFSGEDLIDLNEIYMQLGHVPECIFTTENGETLRKQILNRPCTKAEIDLFATFFGADESNSHTTTKRKGIPKTLHRISLITHPMKNPEPVLGVAVRVGRAMQGLIQTMTGVDQDNNLLQTLARKRQSLLLIGKPGVGKTTALREIADILSQDPTLNVVVVDKTCEIAGDGMEPHPAIGKARWMPVGRADMQHEIMREAVENQTPDVIIVDEISTDKEVQAARTIAQRGVQLVATVHGKTLPELINCRERSILVGGCTSVTLSGMEAERRFDKRKQVQKRFREPVFDVAIELHSRKKWIYHEDVKVAVDSYLEGEPCNAQQFEPERAIAVASIPGEGVFEYCIKCGIGRTCSAHIDGHVSSDTTTDHSSNNYQIIEKENSTYNVSASSKSGSNSHIDGSATGYVKSYASHDSVSSSGYSRQSSSSTQPFYYASGSSKGGNRNSSRNYSWRAPRGSGRCFNCQKPGHYARDCPNKYH